MRNTFINTFFIALFYALLIAFRYAVTADWTIHEWNGVISWATAENLDIGSRIASFYKGFAIFFISFFVFLALLHFAVKIFSEAEISLLNYISIAGCMLMFFKLIGAEMHESLMLIFIIQLLVLIYVFADYFINRFSRTYTCSVTEIAWSVAIGVCAFFLIDYLLLSININGGNYFNKLLFIFSAAALHFCYWSKRKNNSNNLYKWIISLRYIIFIPAFIVLAQEIYMILNQHSIFSIHPLVIFLILLLVAIFISLLRYRKLDGITEYESSAKATISNFYFPWLIIGLIAFAYYRPVVEAPTEMFEQAIPALSIQQYYEFGKIPWLQTFSSHSGADFAAGFIYTLFNGFSGLSYHCYDFLPVVVFVLLLYYTIKKLTGNAYVALIAVMLYPYLNLLMPPYHNMILLSLLILTVAVESPNAKNYFFLFSSLILMPVWRYDLGYANIVALSISLLIFMMLRKELRKSLTALRKGFLYSLILPILLFVFALIKNHQSILININDALAYLKSAQAYGIKDLAIDKNLIYFVHYFIFPCAVSVCFLGTLYWISFSSKKDEAISFAGVAVIFLSIYYYANFHRGLTRHTLAEGWDTAFSSYAYFIVTAALYYFLRKRNKAIQIAAICAFASLILALLKYPQLEFSKNNYYADLNGSIRTPALINISNEKIDRAPVKPDFANETFVNLKEFLDKNIAPDATFLDFSNTPMLYLYTHRRTPNYFNQIPHTAHNYYLQQRLIEDLRNYKVPVVLFSNSPPQWWDSFDGIPNTYRHYLIAEYIYMHYQPYAIINHHTVWLQKGYKLLSLDTAYPKDTLDEQRKDQQLKFLPYVMGQPFPAAVNDSINLFKKITTTSFLIEDKNAGVFTISDPVKNNEANYVLVRAKNISGKRSDVLFSYGNNDKTNGSFSFYLKEDNEERAYLIRLSTQYNWHNNENNNFHLSLSEGKCLVTEFSLMKGRTQ